MRQLKLSRSWRKCTTVRFSFLDLPKLATLNRLLVPPEGWNIPRKKKWRYLFRVLWEDRKRSLIQPSRYIVWLDYWTDGDYQPPNNVRSPQHDLCPHFPFWTDGTNWVDAPEAIDNADPWALESQAMSRTERLKLRLQCKHGWHNPLMNDVDIGEPSPRYEWFAYLEHRKWTKRMAAEYRRLPYCPKKERPIVRQARERLDAEFAWAIELRKEDEEERRQRWDPDNYTKRCLAPHLSPQNMRTREIEERIVAMSEAEWQELLQLVPPATLKDYQRIREELSAKQSGNASTQS
jgi:hypothetical protein